VAVAVEALKQLSFWGGAIWQGDEAVIIGGLDQLRDKPHTMLLRLSSTGRRAEVLEWSARAICRCRVPRDEIMIIGLEGEIVVFDGRGFEHELAIPSRQRAGRTGRLLAAHAIAGRAYAAGYMRQVYRRASPGLWDTVDDGLPLSHLPNGGVAAIEGISGFDESEMYAVGSGGEIWFYHGGRWNRVDSPTNVRLMSSTCAGDGNVYACGQFGTILRGRGNRWNVVHKDADLGYFFDVAWFDGALYVTSSAMLYRFIEGSLQPVAFPDAMADDAKIPTSFFRLATDDTSLWSVGEKDIVAFDGSTWRRVL
jgi:hypothetical protein